MKVRAAGLFWIVVCVTWMMGAAEAADPVGIEEVKILPNRAFAVNGRPFFPLMAWLQDPENFPAVRQCGMNATAGYWRGAGGTADVKEYLERVAQAGLYGVMPYDPGLRGNPHLLAYIHGDEPDLPHQVSDAEVLPGPGMRVNRSTPLWKIVDGVWHTWSVLDPLEGGQVTIRLHKPVTVHQFQIWLTVSKGLSVAKEVAFYGDGKLLCEATLEQKKGAQSIELSEPATFQELRAVVKTVYAGEQVWGSVGEIAGLNESGENVLLSPPRYEPRAEPDAVLQHYREIKKADPSRPVFMTLTGNFHPHFKKWNDADRQRLYPAYIQATDVVGYDIYPIYGWNKPEWIHLVHDATQLLAELAAPRPVYAWIETSKGGQYTGPLERQIAVTPKHIRAEVWMSVVGGATAIGYFTHIWKPSYQQFGVPPENREAIRAVNDQIMRLAPVILAAPANKRVKFAASGDVKVDLMARQEGDSLYLFTVNYDERSLDADVEFTIDGMGDVSVEVVDEQRTLPCRGGTFRDTFKPLDVHIYRLDM